MMKLNNDGTVKITKKEYGLAPEFLVFVDYRATVNGKDYDYIKLYCGIAEAMDEAGKLVDNDGNVYMVKLLIKDSTTEYGIKYADMMSNRGNGWHATTDQNSETQWNVLYNNCYNETYAIM